MDKKNGHNVNDNAFENNYKCNYKKQEKQMEIKTNELNSTQFDREFNFDNYEGRFVDNIVDMRIRPPPIPKGTIPFDGLRRNNNRNEKSENRLNILTKDL